jgi:hypothetical protein
MLSLCAPGKRLPRPINNPSQAVREAFEGGIQSGHGMIDLG